MSRTLFNLCFAAVFLTGPAYADRPREGMHPDIQIVDFDPWYLNPKFMKTSLQAKLVMFEKGIVPDDLPAIFVDLDTAIFGDISAALKLMKDRKSVLMLQSVVLPFGWPVEKHRRL